MKLVINKCHGGFGLSHDAIMEYAKRKGFKLYSWIHPEYPSLLTFYSTIPIDPAPKKSPPNESAYYFCHNDIERNDPILVEIVEDLKTLANDRFSDLRVVNIPDDIEWIVEEYGGMEWIAEKHRTWR